MAQGRPGPASPYRSAYWGAPAAHARAEEVDDAAESDPESTSDRRGTADRLRARSCCPPPPPAANCWQCASGLARPPRPPPLPEIL
jgi:hypothetical protein